MLVGIFYRAKTSTTPVLYLEGTHAQKLNPLTFSMVLLASWMLLLSTVLHAGRCIDWDKRPVKVIKNQLYQICNRVIKKSQQQILLLYILLLLSGVVGVVFPFSFCAYLVLLTDILGDNFLGLPNIGWQSFPHFCFM